MFLADSVVVTSFSLSNSSPVSSAGKPSRVSARQEFSLPEPSERIVAATDGSSMGNPGPSGWAWYVDQQRWAAGGMENSTNQQAELFAVLALLRAVPKDVPLLVRTDSQYTLKSCTEWMRGWKARGWRKADGKPVMNLGLMKELDAALAARTAKTSFEWVRGHRGDFLNEAADSRCTAASRAVRSRKPVDSGPGWRV